METSQSEQAKLIRMGREWYKYRGDDVVDLVFANRRLTQVSREEIPQELFQYLFTLSMNTPHQWEYLPEPLREDWKYVECRFEATAVPLEIANGGFRRGDDPPLENQIVMDNNCLFSFYFTDITPEQLIESVY